MQTHEDIQDSELQFEYGVKMGEAEDKMSEAEDKEGVAYTVGVAGAGGEHPGEEENVMLPNMPEGDPLEDKPDNYHRLTWFSCIACSACCNCCCGILAVHQSKQCDKAYMEGDLEQAGISSRQAYKFAVMAIICGCTFIGIIIVTLILFLFDLWQFPIWW